MASLKSESFPAREAGFGPSADTHYLDCMTDKPKRPRDANQLAKFIVDVATGGEGDPAPTELVEAAMPALAKRGPYKKRSE